MESFKKCLKHFNHEVIHAWSICLAVCSQALMTVFSTLAQENVVPNDVFQTSFRNVSETFPLDVSMDWWSKIYQTVIDIWSFSWLVGSIVLILKRNVLGPLCCNPEIHPPVFYLMWVVVNVVRVWNMVVWDLHHIIAASILSLISPMLSFKMLFMSYSNLEKHKAMLTINNPSIVPWTRYLTQNGLAAFAWWSLVNAVLDFGVVLKYEAGVYEPLVSTIVLIMISLCIITWFISEIFILPKYLRNTFSVYPIVILSLGAMFTRSYHVLDFSGNTIYCGVLMILLTIMSVIHLISACFHTDESSHPRVLMPYLRYEVSEGKNKLNH